MSFSLYLVFSFSIKKFTVMKLNEIVYVLLMNLVQNERQKHLAEDSAVNLSSATV
jgi:hypothetical protein